MNEVQRLSKITHIQRLIIALDMYKQKRYSLDLTDSEYELIKEALEMLKEAIKMRKVKESKDEKVNN